MAPVLFLPTHLTSNLKSCCKSVQKYRRITLKRWVFNWGLNNPFLASLSLLLPISSAIQSFSKDELVVVVTLRARESETLLSMSFWHRRRDHARAASESASSDVHIYSGPRGTQKNWGNCFSPSLEYKMFFSFKLICSVKVPLKSFSNYFKRSNRLYWKLL